MSIDSVVFAPQRYHASDSYDSMNLTTVYYACYGGKKGVQIGTEEKDKSFVLMKEDWETFKKAVDRLFSEYAQ